MFRSLDIWTRLTSKVEIYLKKALLISVKNVASAHLHLGQTELAREPDFSSKHVHPTI